MTIEQKLLKIQQKALSYLDDAESMSVGFKGTEEVVYDLQFITDKLKKVSIFQERLSDLQLKLTRAQIELQQLFSTTKSHLTMKEREFKESDEYKEESRESKTTWLGNQLQSIVDQHEQVKTTLSMVSEVKKAVSDRAQMMKRLDSDLRLHSKLFEAGVIAGATSPSSYTGDQTDEVEL